MQVAMTNAAPSAGAATDAAIATIASIRNPGTPWPALSPAFLKLAADAAREAGFDGYVPDACLINRYAPGTRLSLHQDRDEDDRVAPIVSVSLGLPATFLFGGFARADKTVRVPLQHGDVVVWGGVDRMRFHGVLPVKPGRHEVRGRATFEPDLPQGEMSGLACIARTGVSGSGPRPRVAARHRATSPCTP
jgi:alkylated DNA repair protein (DNA oxidative demethylase)